MPKSNFNSKQLTKSDMDAVLNSFLKTDHFILTNGSNNDQSVEHDDGRFSSAI